ncbi:hypothetical protein B0H67DRAFT_648198 [Lasiosphaeris hirsuta]|uniref:Uncharacterized protein n=1 Tax=Lasiosphaeris hirsuta TaxID=260670 RepID=A0AA40DNW6_9PEZI|nr:hypothetical protein B0H67DRAFT_648198 [Lasiosphaeris hirsuta]
MSRHIFPLRKLAEGPTQSHPLDFNTAFQIFFPQLSTFETPKGCSPAEPLRFNPPPSSSPSQCRRKKDPDWNRRLDGLRDSFRKAMSAEAKRYWESVVETPEENFKPSNTKCVDTAIDKYVNNMQDITKTIAAEAGPEQVEIIISDAKEKAAQLVKKLCEGLMMMKYPSEDDRVEGQSMGLEITVSDARFPKPSQRLPVRSSQSPIPLTCA